MEPMLIASNEPRVAVTRCAVALRGPYGFLTGKWTIIQRTLFLQVRVAGSCQEKKLWIHEYGLAELPDPYPPLSGNNPPAYVVQRAGWTGRMTAVCDTPEEVWDFLGGGAVGQVYTVHSPRRLPVSEFASFRVRRPLCLMVR